jgi:hypothetical protein
LLSRALHQRKTNFSPTQFCNGTSGRVFLVANPPTASGRKAEYSEGALSRGESMPDESVRTKPWKYNDLRAIPAVAWAVHEVQVSLLDAEETKK